MIGAATSFSVDIGGPSPIGNAYFIDYITWTLKDCIDPSAQPRTGSFGSSGGKGWCLSTDCQDGQDSWNSYMLGGPRCVPSQDFVLPRSFGGIKLDGETPDAFLAINTANCAPAAAAPIVLLRNEGAVPDCVSWTFEQVSNIMGTTSVWGYFKLSASLSGGTWAQMGSFCISRSQQLTDGASTGGLGGASTSAGGLELQPCDTAQNQQEWVLEYAERKIKPRSDVSTCFHSTGVWTSDIGNVQLSACSSSGSQNRDVWTPVPHSPPSLPSPPSTESPSP